MNKRSVTNPAMFDTIEIGTNFEASERATVFQGDCLAMLRQMPKESIQLVVTSPPYNLDKEYEKRLDLEDYWVTKDEKLIRKTLSKPADEQKADIQAAGEVPIFSYNQTDFVKDRVAIEVQFGKYSFVAYDLFVKHLAFYVRDQIDVGIEILAMKSLQQNMSSGPGYYEGELYNVIRNGRGVPAVPLVIIGVEP